MAQTLGRLLLRVQKGDAEINAQLDSGADNQDEDTRDPFSVKMHEVTRLGKLMVRECLAQAQQSDVCMVAVWGMAAGGGRMCQALHEAGVIPILVRARSRNPLFKTSKLHPQTVLLGIALVWIKVHLNVLQSRLRLALCPGLVIIGIVDVKDWLCAWREVFRNVCDKWLATTHESIEGSVLTDVLFRVHNESVS